MSTHLCQFLIQDDRYRLGISRILNISCEYLEVWPDLLLSCLLKENIFCVLHPRHRSAGVTSRQRLKSKCEAGNGTLARESGINFNKQIPVQLLDSK